MVDNMRVLGIPVDEPEIVEPKVPTGKRGNSDLVSPRSPPELQCERTGQAIRYAHAWEWSSGVRGWPSAPVSDFGRACTPERVRAAESSDEAPRVRRRAVLDGRGDLQETCAGVGKGTGVVASDASRGSSALRIGARYFGLARPDRTRSPSRKRASDPREITTHDARRGPACIMSKRLSTAPCRHDRDDPYEHQENDPPQDAQSRSPPLDLCSLAWGQVPS